MKEKVLIADDDAGIAWVLDKFFREKGFEVIVARDGASAEKALREASVPLALVDINMPGKDGLTILKDAKKWEGFKTAVIIMTAEGTMKNAIEAMKRGAFDYVTKPIDLDELDVITARAVEDFHLRNEVSVLKERLKEKLAGETVFVGRTKVVERIFKTVGKVAPKDATVLVQGESGTGKELVARLIHANSLRCEGPFIAVNSAAVPGELMESELFGHEKGAFTGATETGRGKFELAGGGTLFLDEIGDMAAGLQAKLLRAVQEREFYRVGGKEPVRVDVRIIAATNQDLEKAVEEKRFREDLYYRLNVVTVTIPPLRERKDDIPLLAEHFFDKFAREMGIETRRLSKDAATELMTYPWPGNVRELENVLRRGVLLSPNTVLTPADIALPQRHYRKESIEDMISARLEPFLEKALSSGPSSSGRGGGRQELYDSVMPFMERPLIKLVLKKTRFNQIKASELLGINRNTLRKKIRDLKISKKDVKD
ncbi:MAG: sigma-54-dependent Fis family transcriptional regulator [Deltaproteobacteria bacterium]|nr:sigma-54-dependent Fis family transcriptional regulator [Deltaproteobacteria bacterium]